MSPMPSNTSARTHLEMLVEFVENKAHAIHQTIHVCWLAFLVAHPAMRSERRLESFEVLHPFQREVMLLHVGLIEHEDEWKFGLVENTGVDEDKCQGSGRGPEI